jgi:hypothetical protein
MERLIKLQTSGRVTRRRYRVELKTASDETRRGSVLVSPSKFMDVVLNGKPQLLTTYSSAVHFKKPRQMMNLFPVPYT